MTSQDIYSQIDSFVNKRIGKSKLYEIKFYVDTETAKDKASFIDFLSKENEIIENKKHYKTIDLCYGSGNLTAHIFGDTDIGYSELYLNDLNINDRNNNISIGTKLDYDFLDSSKFTTQYDLIVFNPQIGGKDTYSKGLVEFEKINPIIYDGSFEDYLSSNGIDIDLLSIFVDENEKSIFIHSDNLTKSDMIEKFKDIRIFNYYDVFFKSKESKMEGEYTSIVQFRKTLERISHDNTIVVFYGEMNYYKYLFADYTNVRLYLQESTKQLFVLAKGKVDKKCYEKIENEFIENEKCEIEKNADQQDLDIGELMKELENNEVGKSFDGVLKSESKTIQVEESNEKPFLKFTNREEGNIEFPHKNILLKGVPGTGKSKTIDNIIFHEDKLNMKDLPDNVLRINIHSASSNSDLMQGVSISTTENNENVLYKEKQGAILNHIFKAIYKPKQPFVLVLEEIQENSLNELIGDLIYLIEDKKRAIVDLDLEDDTEISYDNLFEKIDEKYKIDSKDLHKVELPSLVENSHNNIKMIVPNNLFIFCTSNYRDDKKVIEDNLLRRFDVIEIYPKTKEELGQNKKGEDIFKSQDVSEFLEKLNDKTLEQFKDETHPDRYMIGHANWLDIEEIDNDETKIKFYKALLKVIVEFKEIKEINFDSDVKPVLEKVFNKDNDNSERIKEYLDIFYNDEKLELKSYKNIVDILQQEVYQSFL